MEIFEEIKSRVAMRDVLEMYGISPLRGKNIYRCPFHSPDNKPSANIIKGTEKFHCFVCNQTWDIFDIVQHFEQCDTKKAIRILDTKFNLNIYRKLSHKEKLEIARKQKERERQKAVKEQWKKFELRTLDRIADQIRFWEQVQSDCHLTRGEFRSGNWELGDLFFTALKQQNWLNWLYTAICEFDHPECEFDYIYGTNKQELLLAIKDKKIKL